MTSERTRQTTPEALRAERFLSEIYNITANWLRMDRNAQIVKEFGSQKIDSWGSQAIYAPDTTLPMDLKKAIVLQDVRNMYGLALGSRRRSRYDRQDYPSLQFGVSLPSDLSSQPYRPHNALDELRRLVVPSRHDFKKAEFYYDGRKLWTDCWIDEVRHGGQQINAWKETAISGKGESAVVETIKRLVRNFDPV